MEIEKEVSEEVIDAEAVEPAKEKGGNDTKLANR